ncbi:HesA/MoeB/ThiF family protein [Chitinophaga filiformis]|uniref:ThiF family adenylyltransferase n=1 Tax=Chitinophaga filiformis TaxID=104663 RepID=A0ABY4HY61_CHIFI|nr:ThiF family adenylyltransferase [Chitinophaga filiformis]UPK67949.1 ThiF family adenylyltransferase [Chitinophaga filiformis]
MNKIRISKHHYQLLCHHLFPGDDREAVALALCSRNIHGSDHILQILELFPVAYEDCYERKPDLVRWPTNLVNPLLEKAMGRGYAILKIHCHPGGGERFSEFDDESDQTLFSSVHAWLDSTQPHASCIMLPDKRLFGRFFTADMQIETIHQISVAGDDLLFWNYSEMPELDERLQARNLQTFGRGTVQQFSQMRIGVVGNSGTGSPTIEQLKRLGVKELVLVDPDYIDHVNLNRILGATLQDANQQVPKPEVMKREIEKVGFGTTVTCFNSTVAEPAVINALAQCDVLFSCVDGIEGRHILNLISSCYLIPLFDMGVKLQADGKGGITGIYGTVHYIIPGGSSLLSRKQYTMAGLQAESIRRADQAGILKNQYLADVQESQPAVISINMQIAAIAVNDFLARIHPFRNFDNDEVNIIRYWYCELLTKLECDNEPCPVFSHYVGLGDCEPLLNTPQFGKL